jgi:hypothetical protein
VNFQIIKWTQCIKPLFPQILLGKSEYTYTVNYGIKIQHLTEYKTNTKLTEKNIGIKIHGPPDTGGSCL